MSLNRKIKRLKEIILRSSVDLKMSHVASSLSCIEIMAALFFNNMKSEDKFLMSKGHAGLAYYATLALSDDFKEFKEKDIKKFTSHPNKNRKIKSLFTSGSLGHGFPVGLGLAISKPMSRIYVLMGDGECDEGSVWETAYLTRKLNVLNLIPIIDANKFSVWQKIDTLTLINAWKGFGWKVILYDQDSYEEFSFDNHHDIPTVYIISTIKGKGLKTENTMDAHGFSMDKQYYEENFRRRIA
jgi:transketolase